MTNVPKIPYFIAEPNASAAAAAAAALGSQLLPEVHAQLHADSPEHHAPSPGVRNGRVQYALFLKIKVRQAMCTMQYFIVITPHLIG